MAKATRSNRNTIYFKLEGTRKIKPRAFSGREIATIITNLEDSLRAVAISKNPQLDESKLYISLVEVVHDSAGFRFVPSFRQVTTAFLVIASSVQEGNYERIPPRAVTGLKEIQKVITHKDNCVGAFIARGKRLSQISESTEINIPTIGNITGETTLFGKIQRIGGRDPKVVLKLHNGDLLSLDVSESLARSFGNRLYTEVGIKGEATWSYSDNKLLSFRIDSLTDFEDTPIDVALEQLKGSIGKYWDDVEDIKEALLIDS